MKIPTLFLRNLLIFCISFSFVSFTFAQDKPGPNPSGGTSQQEASKSGSSKSMPERKARCKACNYVAMQYNDLNKKILGVEYYIRYLKNSMKKAEDALNQAEANIANLKAQFIKHPSANLSNQIAAAEKTQKSLSRTYAQLERELSKEERDLNQLEKDLEEAEATLNACEAEFCKVAMAHPTRTQALNLLAMTQIQLGLLLGNITNSRSGNINTSAESFSGSHSQNNVVSGLQARFLFGSPEYVRTFLLVNALTLFNATNTILRARTDSFASNDSLLRLRTLWIAHILIGLQTALIFNNFNFNAGVGGAVINQQLQTSIEETSTTSNTTTQTSLAPSGMLSLDYKLCKSCFGAHDLILSGQFSADKYPSVNSTVTTPLGNTYRNNVNSGWQFSEALVLSMQF